MLVRLSGILIDKKMPAWLWVDVHGLAYEVHVSQRVFYAPQLVIDTPITLYTDLLIRDDRQHLFGFLQPTERALFRLLIQVSGVGPKMALKLLSNATVSELVNALLCGDERQLTAVPGLGKKTAQRLMIELQNKIAEWSKIWAADLSTLDPACQESPSNSWITLDKNVQQAIAGLVALGYTPKRAKQAVLDHQQHAGTTAELIRLALHATAPNDATL